ncbi:DUF374 domain-containing protein [Rickettsiales bacterium]|nr:DUF374 domain-containing protein [Rickettsiales bacterium]
MIGKKLVKKLSKKYINIIRSFFYSPSIQWLLSWIITIYIHLIYYSSSKEFTNFDIALKNPSQNKPLLILFWHNRLMMIPHFARKIRQKYPNYKIMTLASRHGDGKIVGRVMENFDFISILGSTQNGRKSSRGIGIDAIRKIFLGLKNSQAIGITPDGPRGPSQKINGEVINIARISSADILVVSYSSSKFKIFNSWDKFKMPLPFSKLAYICDKQLYNIERSANNEQVEDLKIIVEKALNKVQDQADQMILKNNNH